MKAARTVSKNAPQKHQPEGVVTNAQRRARAKARDALIAAYAAVYMAEQQRVKKLTREIRKIRECTLADARDTALRIVMGLCYDADVYVGWLGTLRRYAGRGQA